MNAFIAMEPNYLMATADGSSTIHSSQFNASYHSLHGALQESRHVFIQNGLNAFGFVSESQLSILEIGFGSGLNALLAWNWANQNKVSVKYTGCEPYPLDLAMLSNFELADAGSTEQFQDLHQCDWDVAHQLASEFTFQKTTQTWPNFKVDSPVDIIWYDAFSPAAQPELWDKAALQACVDSLRSGGIWVSYCAKGDVRRMLIELGCDVERLPGPPHKRHMLRACKR